MEDTHKINIHDGNLTEDTLTSYLDVVTDVKISDKFDRLIEHMHMANNGTNDFSSSWTILDSDRQKADTLEHIHNINIDDLYILQHKHTLNNDHSHIHHVSEPYSYYGRVKLYE